MRVFRVAGVTGLVMPSAAEIEVKVLKHLWTPERAQRSMHPTKLHSSIIPVLSPTQVLPSSGKKVSKLGEKCIGYVDPKDSVIYLNIANYQAYPLSATSQKYKKCNWTMIYKPSASYHKVCSGEQVHMSSICITVRMWSSGLHQHLKQPVHPLSPRIVSPCAFT